MPEFNFFYTVAVVIVVIWVFSCVQVLNEYERGVIFRLGRLIPVPKGPGLILVFKPIDRIQRVSLQIDAVEVPPQDVITRDNVSVKVNAVIFMRVINPNDAVVKVTKVEVKQVDLPAEMQRAIAKQAEAERERRAKIIHAEGEFSASQKLADAAHVLHTEPVAIQLRYLQTLTEIGVEKNTTIVFPIPVDIFKGLLEAKKG